MEVQVALKPVKLLESSVLKTTVMVLPLLNIGAIDLFVPQNLTIRLSSESNTGKVKLDKSK